MIASAGGLDGLVFTAGVGENCAPLREMVCKQFSFLGVSIDPARNAETGSDCEISSANSAVKVLVVHTEEDWEIARECCHVLYNRG